MEIRDFPIANLFSCNYLIQELLPYCELPFTDPFSINKIFIQNLLVFSPFCLCAKYNCYFYVNNTLKISGMTTVTLKRKFDFYIDHQVSKGNHDAQLVAYIARRHEIAKILRPVRLRPRSWEESSFALVAPIMYSYIGLGIKRSMADSFFQRQWKGAKSRSHARRILAPYKQETL